MKIASLTVVVLALLFFFPAAGFSSYRCGDSVITEGDTKPEVLVRCGNPDWVEYGYSPVPNLMNRYSVAAGNNVNVYAGYREKWYYNVEVNSLIHVITFDRGTVVDIRTEGYAQIDVEH